MIRIYFSAGILLHAITVIELLAIVCTGIFAGSHTVKFPVLIMACMFTVFTQLDARSRYQEFKKVRDQLIRYGPNRRIFKSVSSSRCQRDAGLAAARQLGFGCHCANHFRKAGYRWYHLLPDFVVTHPNFFLYPAFWRTTFFAPTYHSRYSVESVIDNSRQKINGFASL